MTGTVDSLNGDMSVRAVMDTREMDWIPSPSGAVLRKRLHLVGEVESGQVTTFVRYLPGSSFPEHDHPEGEEIFVIEGAFEDARGRYPGGTWLRLPAGAMLDARSDNGCVAYVKTGALHALRSA